MAYGNIAELPEGIVREHVRFDNRYGIAIAADLYYAEGIDRDGAHPALVVGAPYGGVKEQGPCVYAGELARRGFVVLTFDQVHMGESGGEPRNLSSPDLFAESFSACVDYLGVKVPFVDRDRIGVNGICGSGGFADTSALSMMQFSCLQYIAEISPRPVLFVAGDRAHSRSFSEKAYEMAAEPKELFIVEGAEHIDLYDRTDLIPFEKLEAFFKEALR